MPPLPATLEGITRWRCGEERMLPWFDAKTGARIRFLVDHALPLALDDALHVGQSTSTRSVLRRVARVRCRTGFTGWTWDRDLFHRSQQRDARLKQTWMA